MARRTGMASRNLRFVNAKGDRCSWSRLGCGGS
jgi:hypothetical protein